MYRGSLHYSDAAQILQADKFRSHDALLFGQDGMHAISEWHLLLLQQVLTTHRCADPLLLLPLFLFISPAVI